MKKVFLYAYNRCNLGDDLFVRLLLHRYPTVKFYLRGNPTTKERFQSEENFKVLSENSWLINLAKKIRSSFAARIKGYQEQRCDAMLYVGGSIFIEYENWETILNWWRYEVERRKFYVLGANFGPWHTEEYRRQIGEIFGKMQDVCYRDKYSKELFSDIHTVRYAPDILLGYKMPKKDAKEKQAFISVINCESKDEGENQLARYDKTYIEGLTKLTQQLIVEGWKVVLSSFCKAEGDEEGVRKIINGVKESASIEVQNYDGNNGEVILEKMAESAIVYGSRFHAVILGFAAQRPVVPVIYSNKTKHILEDMGFEGEYFDIRELDKDFSARAVALAHHPEHQVLSGIEHFSKQSEKHFLKLDELLNNGRG